MANRSWSDLPVDLLNLVAEILVSVCDLVRLSEVCKAWRPAVLEVIQRRTTLPLLITYQLSPEIVFSKMEISDSSFASTNSVNKILTRQVVKSALVDTKVCASKHGWLLLFKKVENYHFSCGNNMFIKSKRPRSCTLFSFYNPFNHKVIKVPPLDLDINERTTKVTFSTTPSSPKCTIFVISRGDGAIATGGYRYIISTCCLRGKIKWNTIHPTCPGSVGKMRDVAYVDGVFYCLFTTHCSLQLGAFNVALGHWDVMTYTLRPFGIEWMTRYLVEFDGELLLACFQNKDSIGRYYWCIYRFDPSLKRWTRIKSLGNRVLFLQPEFPCGSSSIVVPAVGEASEYANRILFLVWSGCRSFSSQNEGEWRHHQTYEWEKRGFKNWIEHPNSYTC